MRIQLVTHYYPPEIGAPQARLSEMASYWASQGEQVTVITGMPNHPTGVIPDAYRGALLRTEKVSGVRVVRNWLYATPNEGIVKKTLGHLSFMVTAVLTGMPRAGRPDVVVVSSPTFFSILSAWVIARLRRARFVVEVRDLWPAIFVELGVLRNRFVIRILEAVELRMYAAADRVVVVTEGFRANLIARGVPAEKLVTIRNGVDLTRFDPHRVALPEVRRRMGCPEGSTLALYVGAHGISQGLSTLIDAAALLEGEGVHVALVGEGADKARVAEHLNEVGATNVTMLPGVTREEVAELVAAADVCLVPLRDVPLFETFLPSKMFEFMGAGKAIIGGVRGESAAILLAAGARVVPPEDSRALAQELRELAADPEAGAAMGRAGRRFAVRECDRDALAQRYLDLFAELEQR